MIEAETPGERWNTGRGQVWADMGDVVDRLFAPLERVLVDEVAAEPAHHVLDIGCGTGATTVAIARRLGADGRAVGLDISEAMIAVSRDRATRDGVDVDFVLADAQNHDFGPAKFDTLASRFGVMFFDDSVAAFSNLRAGSTSGARLRFLVWRGLEDNPMHSTASAAGSTVVPLTPRAAGAAGAFRFADESLIRPALEGGGWRDLRLRSVDVECRATRPDLLTFVTRVGPLGDAYPGLDVSTRTEVMDALVEGYEPFRAGEEYRIPLASWMVCAEAP